VVDAIARLILGDPGNYLKYYVGYLNFMQLRDDMAETYGDSFSLQAFHEAVLRMGPAPFDVLKEHFLEYYNSAL
jgi:uncharacterized protein (DUF885 family)